MKTKTTVGIFHYQLGFTDGVSLEVDKWKTVLEGMGYRVVLCAGRLGDQEGVLIPELYHHRPEVELINENFFGHEEQLNPDMLENLLQKCTGVLREKLKESILEQGIEILLVNNIWSVAMNIPAAVALEMVKKELDLKAIAHHHDFYWERKSQLENVQPIVRNVLQDFVPPRERKIKHVVINSLARSSLQRFKGIPSTIVPNVMDFNSPDWSVDDYNRDLRERIGMKEGDICILQATRIIPRKGIELAIDLVKALNEPQRREYIQQYGLYNGQTFGSENKIVLILAGYDRDDPTGAYLQKLKSKSKDLGVVCHHIDSFIGSKRKIETGSKIYTLWDTYTVADIVTYPSLWEGWGNQFLEALRAKLPIVLFEYPVYKQDIEDKGFNVISLGSEINGRDELDLVQIPPEVIQNAADQCVTYLTNRSAREQMVKKNFKIAQKYYSYEVLGNKLIKLL